MLPGIKDMKTQKLNKSHRDEVFEPRPENTLQSRQGVQGCKKNLVTDGVSSSSPVRFDNLVV